MEKGQGKCGRNSRKKWLDDNYKKRVKLEGQFQKKIKVQKI